MQGCRPTRFVGSIWCGDSAAGYFDLRRALKGKDLSEFRFPPRRNLALFALGSLGAGGLGFWWKGGTFAYDVWLFLGLIYVLVPVLVIGCILYLVRMRWRAPMAVIAVMVYAAIFAILQAGFLPLSGLRAHLRLADAKTFCLLVERTIKTEVVKNGAIRGGEDNIDRLIEHHERPRYLVRHVYSDGVFRCSIFPANRLSAHVTYSSKDGKWRNEMYREPSRQVK